MNYHTYVQNVHRWLTHLSAVACGSLSPVRQNKLTKVHFKTRELILATVAACVSLQHCPKHDNPVDWGWVNWDHSSLVMKSRQSDLLKLET